MSYTPRMPTSPDAFDGKAWPVARNPAHHDGRTVWLRLLPSHREVAVTPSEYALVAGFCWLQYGAALQVDEVQFDALAGVRVLPLEHARPRAFDEPFAVAVVRTAVGAVASDGRVTLDPAAPQTACLLPMEELLAAVRGGTVTAAGLRRLGMEDLVRRTARLYRLQHGPLSSDASAFQAPVPWSDDEGGTI